MSYHKLKTLFREQSILNDVSGFLSWDMATYMPDESRKQRVEQIKIIYDYKKRIFDEIKKKDFFKKVTQAKLSDLDQQNYNLMKLKFEYFDCMPYKLIEKKTILGIECEGLWRKARIKNDFNIVKKKIVELVEVVRQEAEILSQEKQISRYDSLLEKYDRSLKTDYLNQIFPDIEKFIKKYSPLIEAQQKHNKYIKQNEFLDESEQIKLSKIFMKKLGFNFSKGRIDKSLHPFCGGSTDDIRITTRFDKENTFSCFDALMHETGHAIYEQGLPRKWVHQPVGTSGGMSLHESQSLFVEMQLIKSLPASTFIEKIISEHLMKKSSFWNSRNIFNIRNKIEKGFIRVDSDEVHYPLHIIHRFKIEYQIIEKNADISLLPDLWNQEFKKLFSLKVPNDNFGCLQDIHWYGGDFGYFPTYSIGAFIASQLKYKIKEDIPNMTFLIKKGEFKPITSWLKEKIHQKGNIFRINEILEKSTGEKLNTIHYKNHIKERYIKKVF